VVIITSFLLISMVKERSEFVQRRVAATDALTGVASRRAFLDEGARQLGTAHKRGHEVSLLLFDLDRFKQVNDCYGHHAGDHVLQLFAAKIGETLRGGDLFGRIGGEEFAALLPGVSAAQALDIAERCRATIAAFDFTLDDVPIRMAVSVGVSAAQTPNCTIEELLGQADRALYLAKSAGRNRAHAYAPPPEPNWLAA
jgi:diguanylate cyclase (GGDEF)-like protein